MMRIAMITGSTSRKGAGVATAVEGLSASVANRGHDVRVFALEDSSWVEDVHIWKGAPVSTFKTRGPAPLGYAPDMLEALQVFTPDVAHLHGLWMYTSSNVVQLSRRSGCAYMISPHGMLAPAALAFSRRKKWLARKLYQDRCFRLAGAMHATSQTEADQIRAFGLTMPIALYPNGVALRARPSGVVPERTVLSLGRLHPVKGLDILIRAWADVSGIFPDWTLRIIGPDCDGYANYLRSLAAGYGLRNVSIEGPIYEERKFRLMAEASLFVLPSLTENFGLTVVESLMMGTPVIASRGTPWAELDEQGCGAWVPGTVGAFARALATFMRLPDSARRDKGASGRAWVREKFSWDSVAEQAEESYVNLGVDH